jgi:Tfp pilus assembly protein PilE
MKAFITAVVVAAILAIAAGTTLNSYVQKTSTEAYLEPSARL